MQRLSGFKGKDIFNMDSTEGTSMITSIGLSRLSLRPWPVPSNTEVPNPNLSLRSLLSDIFSRTSSESFEEGYNQLRLPILGSISAVA